jgi:hypothetical protein
MKQRNFAIGVITTMLLVSLIYLYLQLTQPPKSSELRNAALSDVIITLERTACYGECPVYKLTISGDGNVVYEGERFVKSSGTQKYQISQDKVKELVDEFHRTNYFTLNDSYSDGVTDFPSAITSITVNGTTKTIDDYQGAQAPKELRELEDKIDEIANSNKWI